MLLLWRRLRPGDRVSWIVVSGRPAINQIGTRPELGDGLWTIGVIVTLLLPLNPILSGANSPTSWVAPK